MSNWQGHTRNSTLGKSLKDFSWYFYLPGHAHFLKILCWRPLIWQENLNGPGGIRELGRVVNGPWTMASLHGQLRQGIHPVHISHYPCQLSVTQGSFQRKGGYSNICFEFCKWKFYVMCTHVYTHMRAHSWTYPDTKNAFYMHLLLTTDVTLSRCQPTANQNVYRQYHLVDTGRFFLPTNF